MYCSVCGSAADASAAYCGSCGRPLSITGVGGATRPVNSDTRDVRLHRRSWALPLLLVTLTVGGGAWFAATRDTPARAAEQWINAVVKLDASKASELTCQAKQTELQAAGGFATGLLLLSGVSGLTSGSTSDMSLETIREDADNAEVRVTGKMHMSILGVSQTQALNSILHMKRESGRWRYCGETTTAGSGSGPTTTESAKLPSATPGPKILKGRGLNDGEAWRSDTYEIRLTRQEGVDTCGTPGLLVTAVITNLSASEFREFEIGAISADFGGRTATIWAGSPPTEQCYSDSIRVLRINRLRSGESLQIGLRVAGLREGRISIKDSEYDLQWSFPARAVVTLENAEAWSDRGLVVTVRRAPYADTCPVQGVLFQVTVENRTASTIEPRTIGVLDVSSPGRVASEIWTGPAGPGCYDRTTRVVAVGRLRAGESVTIAYRALDVDAASYVALETNARRAEWKLR